MYGKDAKHKKGRDKAMQDRVAFAAVFSFGDQVQVDYGAWNEGSITTRGTIASFDTIGLALTDAVHVNYRNKTTIGRDGRIFIPWTTIIGVTVPPAKCSVEGCEDDANQPSGMCGGHQWEAERRRSPDAPDELPF